MNAKEKTDRYILNTYARFDKVFVAGEGCYLFDEAGNRYTDFLAGIAVCGLGHSHPAVADALAAQAKKLVHVSNLFYTRPQAELAAGLVERSFADRVFFSNSGAEANEAAIKLARRYFQADTSTSKYKIITMENSFHGRTMATLSATGQEKIRQGFAPVLEGFVHVPFNDVAALEAAVDSDTCAVMIEPVQGEGGVIPADRSWLEAARDICDENDALLIFDEIQTGMGRCGELFACQAYGVTPDIMTLAKALGNGLPIGATLASEKAARGFAPGSHASTFGGTPLVTSAAGVVLNTVADDAFLERVRERGAYFREILRALKEKHPMIKQVRGLGLLNALVIDGDAGRIVNKCLENGFIVNAVQGSVLRFAPPLIIEETHIDALAACLDAIFAKER